MTISQDLSAPLVVVCGSTGVQGGSVINALGESDKKYRLRGLTRDNTKTVAQELTARGVEMTKVSLSVGNEENVKKAFKGANIIFAMTNFWEHITKQREIDEGKLLVDAAKVVGVDLFVWSGLESVTEATGGKYKLDDFESKAEITKYAKSSGIPLVVVQAGLYASVLTTMFKPEKQADGSFIVGVPFDPVKYVLPIIDVVPDYGLFVREAIESPKFGAGTEVLSCGELISFSNAITQLSEITGKNVKCVVIKDEDFLSAFYGPRHIAVNVLAFLRSQQEFGYYGSKDITPSLQDLSRKPHTWGEFVKATKWDEIFA